MLQPVYHERQNREFASELKFVASKAVAEQIREWARERLEPDPHSSNPRHEGYTITSVYFDTEKFDVYQKNGSYGRSKYRVRRYGNEPRAFLERKLKTRGLVSKRRTTVPLEDLSLLAMGGADPRWHGYWYQQRLDLRSLKPICRICYDRTARVAMGNDGPIRLTIDESLTAHSTEVVNFQEEGRGAALLTDKSIIELKFRSEMPMVFKQLVEQFALSPTQMSKYRLAVTELKLAKLPPNGAAAPAALEPAYA